MHRRACDDWADYAVSSGSLAPWNNRRSRSPLAAGALVALTACGQAARTERDPGAAESGGAPASAGAGGSGDSRGGDQGRAGSPSGGRPQGTTGGATSAPTALDPADCASRPFANCEGVVSEYGPVYEFSMTPALAQCEPLTPRDGCRELEFSFDAAGCATAVTTGPDGRQIPELRECLTAALTSARWSCLASEKLAFHESCFIH